MSKQNLILIIAAILTIYALGMRLDVMEIDAAQYASISQEMVHSGNYLEVYDRGKDYLDKPPLLFWVSSLSFEIFGVSNFSYKLPSILFSLLGIWATYRLGKSLYNKSVGLYAALVLSSCQAWFLMNHDVKTDTILAGCIVFAIWQLYLFLQTNRLLNLAAASLGIAGAMLTKGPIGAMVPALAIGTHLLVRGELKKLFQYQWLLMPVIILVCLSPMLVGLYTQYDLHPGKIINGVPIQSGLTFYFWTQSFGRLTGQNVWKDDTTMLYFTHTFLWAFAPWFLFFLVGLWEKTKRLVRSKFRSDTEEAISWGGFVLPFVAFSFSHYKLPHYIFPLFPMAAIVAGKYLFDLLENSPSLARIDFFKYAQFLMACLILAASLLLAGISFPMPAWQLWTFGVVVTSSSVFFFKKGTNNFQKVVIPSLISILAFNALLNIHIYPSLFQYVASNHAARIVAATQEGSEALVTLNLTRASLDFYSHHTVPIYTSVSELKNAEHRVIWVYTDQDGYEAIRQAGTMPLEVKELDDFHISKLTMLFLNPATRKAQIRSKYLLKIDNR